MSVTIFGICAACGIAGPVYPEPGGASWYLCRECHDKAAAEADSAQEAQR